FASLGLVVRRLHPFGVHEGPQPLLVAQQLLAGPRRLATPALAAAPQRPPYRLAHGLHRLLQTPSRQLAGTPLMPQVEQRVAPSQQALPNGLARLAPVNHRLEVPPPMRPAPLQPLDPPIRLQPVAGGHPRVILAQQLLGYLRRPAFGYAEQAGQRGHHGP